MHINQSVAPVESQVIFSTAPNIMNIKGNYWLVGTFFRSGRAEVARIAGGNGHDIFQRHEIFKKVVKHGVRDAVSRRRVLCAGLECDKPH